MTKEKLKKAKELEGQINEYNRLLFNSKETYSWCLIKINCANSNGYSDDYGTIPREILKKLLDVIREERDKLAEELEQL